VSETSIAYQREEKRGRRKKEGEKVKWTLLLIFIVN